MSRALAGCCTSQVGSKSRAGSETVLISYHAAPGKEAELQAALVHARQYYQSEHLVYDQPHVLVRDAGEGDNVRFVEIFTWIKSPDHPSAGMSDVWKMERSLCEARGGHTGIEGGPEDVVPEK